MPLIIESDGRTIIAHPTPEQIAEMMEDRDRCRCGELLEKTAVPIGCNDYQYEWLCPVCDCGRAQ